MQSFCMQPAKACMYPQQLHIDSIHTSKTQSLSRDTKNMKHNLKRDSCNPVTDVAFLRVLPSSNCHVLCQKFCVYLISVLSGLHSFTDIDRKKSSRQYSCELSKRRSFKAARSSVQSAVHETLMLTSDVSGLCQCNWVGCVQ